MSWSGGLIHWTDNNSAYISVVFSWQLQSAFQIAVWYKSRGLSVFAGGPAIAVARGMMSRVANIDLELDDVVMRHNPDATFTSRGCIRNCSFCVVPKSEGTLHELDNWPIRPIICDNNFLATSRKHFDNTIDKLKPLARIDFNQGLDARLLNDHHVDRLRELDIKTIRLAWDHIGIEKQWMAAFERLTKAGFKPGHIQSYVLFNFSDTPDDALYRLETIKKLGALPNPMRYQPLDTIKRNQYVHPNWTQKQLKDFMRYWSRQVWLGHIPFDEYRITGYSSR